MKKVISVLVMTLIGLVGTLAFAGSATPGIGPKIDALPNAFRCEGSTVDSHFTPSGV